MALIPAIVLNMKTKHIFVPALDAEEILPFAVRKTKTPTESIKERHRANAEVVKFIEQLEKNYQEQIYYMGTDIIKAKIYERFMFEKGGFFEILVESPLAMNAHFVHNRQAKKFCAALKKTLGSVLKKGRISKMFIKSIKASREDDKSLNP